jgi:hypothetical protein
MKVTVLLQCVYLCLTLSSLSAGAEIIKPHQGFSFPVTLSPYRNMLRPTSVRINYRTSLLSFPSKWCLTCLCVITMLSRFEGWIYSEWRLYIQFLSYWRCAVSVLLYNEVSSNLSLFKHSGNKPQSNPDIAPLFLAVCRDVSSVTVNRSSM